MNQTESYIVLKPIAERFSRIANEMTDDEIKSLIKSSLRDQLSNIRFGEIVGICVDEFFDDEDNLKEIEQMIRESVKAKLGDMPMRGW